MKLSEVDYDIRITGNKKNGITLDEIKKIAERCNYTIVLEGGNKEVHGILAKKNKVGRPPKNISKDEVLAMRKKGNSIKEICKVLGVSRATV